MDGPGEWLTPTEAARVLGVDMRTVRRRADRGNFRVFWTLGGHRRLYAADVERATQVQPKRKRPTPPRSAAAPHESSATEGELASLARWVDGDPAWLTSTQAARVLGLSQPYVTQLSNAGKLPYELSPTGRRLYRPRQIEAIAQARLAQRRRPTG